MPNEIVKAIWANSAVSLIVLIGFLYNLRLRIKRKKDVLNLIGSSRD